MSRLTGKINRRIMALVLSLAMIMPNMTAYAGELNMPQADVQADIDADAVTVDVAENEEDAIDAEVGTDDAEYETESGGEILAETEGDIFESEPETDNEIELGESEILESGEIVEKTYVLDPTKDLGDVEADAENNITSGTLVGTDVYFRLIAEAGGYVRNNAPYLRISQRAKGKIEFTVEGTATVRIEAASTGGGQTSGVLLMNESGSSVPEKDGKVSVTDTSKSPLNYENVPAGTYTVLTPDGTNYVRDARIHSITVTETSSRERPQLSSVAAPEVKSVTQVQGDTKLSVSVENALVGYNGGDRLIVIMEDSNGNIVDGIEGISAIGGTEHPFAIDAGKCATGTYTIKAKLVRGTEGNMEELVSTVTKDINYVSLLKAPTELQVTNKGKVEESDPVSGSVELTWKAAVGAEYYVIEIVDKDGTIVEKSTDDDSTSIIINSGLTINEKYTFKVYAAGQIGGNVDKSAEAAIEENYEIIEGEGDALPTKGLYVLKVDSDVEIFGAATKQNGDTEKAGTGKFFTLIYSTASKVEDKNQTFPDGVKEGRKINFGGAASIEKNAIKFTVTAASKVTVYWQAGADNREMQILDGEGNEVASTNLGVSNNTLSVSSMYVPRPGTYYLGGKGGNNSIFRVEVDNEYERVRPLWANVADPEITGVSKDSTGMGVNIAVNAKIGPEGDNGEADKLEVIMYDTDDKAVGSATTTETGVNPVLSIIPEKSGRYRFEAILSRNDEEEVKRGYYPVEENEFYTYVVPLETPKLKDLKNKGAVDRANEYGSVELSWDAVNEADRYVIAIEGKDTEYEGESPVTVTNKTALLIDEGLKVGKTYTFSICAQRDATGEFDGNNQLVKPETSQADTKELKIEAEYKSDWKFVVYGLGTTTKSSGFVAADGTKATDNNTTSPKVEYSGSYGIKDIDGNVKETITPTVDKDAGDFVRVWTWDGKGKIVPKDTDGLAFYYTEINPQTTNFKLSANLHVNRWNLTNGQEGFGLMATDRIGENGNSNHLWTNSYKAIASKVDYYWDSVNGKMSTSEGTKVSLRLGIGSTAKTGITAENLPIFENDVTAAVQGYYNTETLPLDTSVRTGNYDNIIANGLGDSKNAPKLIEDFNLAIELNATGYFVYYTPLNKKADGTFEKGTTAVLKYYDRDALSKIEDDTVYIGFFTSRYADITFSQVDLDTRRYDASEEKEIRPTEDVKLKASVASSKTANSADYKLIYTANWRGKVTVRDESGTILTENGKDIIEGTPDEDGSVEIPVKLNVGDNKFQITFDPDQNYDPYNGNPFTRLTSDEAKVDTVTITWKKYGEDRSLLYVSPKGTALGDGTKTNPLDIYTAIKYVQAGQTIYLMGGTYSLTSTVKINRGIDGTADKKIYMIADPETCKDGVRPVFDFNSACPGMVFAGNYWYCSGFDVTKSANQAKGIQVSGDNNVLDGIHIYKNGSTGLQISRLLTSDKTSADWPKNNLILNCTSYLNADAGYEDADGFAAKLTVGEGNVFDGCVAAFNADDGWDLFAKVETGPIEPIKIVNSIAYRNGYLLIDEATEELAWFDEASSGSKIIEKDAGNGNGFKMGGSSISGAHMLENSVAFYNKSKGIDSNSGPDIQVKNSISFNNESFNVAMYSNAKTTNYSAEGVISYKNNADLYDIEDRIGLKNTPGMWIDKTQENCVEKIFNNTNFFWNKLSNVSESGSNFYQHYTTWTDKTQPPRPEIVVTDDWFKDLDYDNWVRTYCSTIHSASRRDDGTIDLHGFLELSDEGKAAMKAAGVESAGIVGGTPSKNEDDLSKEIGTETSGNINLGDSDKETGEGANSDDFAQKPGDVVEGDLWIAIADRDLIEYTGKAVKPVIRVYSGTETILKAGKDYTVTYKNNVNAYVGAYQDKYYENNAKTYEAKYGNVTMSELKAAYSSNSGKKPTIIIRGKGNYTKQAAEVYFDINPVSLTNDEMKRIGISNMALISNNNRPVKVNPAVTFNNRKLSSANDKEYKFEVYQEVEDESSHITEKPVGTDVSVGSYKVRIIGKNNFSGITTVNLNVVDGKDKNILASNFRLKNNKIPDQYREGYKTIEGREIPLPVELSATGTNPALVVQDKNGNTLVEGVHYKISGYKNNIDIGTATVIVTGLSYDDNGTAKAYVGSKEFKFRIVAPTLNTMLRDGKAKFINTKDLEIKKDESTGRILIVDTSKITLFGDSKSYDYEGKPVDPVNDDNLGLAVERGDGSWYLLKQGTDYKLTYSNNARKGNAAAVFKGIGNYRGSVTQKFSINEFDLSKIENLKKLDGTFALTENDEGGLTPVMFESYKQENGAYVYSGLKAEVSYEKSGAKPTVSLRINGNLLRVGRDYTVVYKDNMQTTDSATRKMPTIIIRGRNGLKGTLTGTFTISKKSFDDSENKITVTAQDVKISKSTADGYTGSYKTRVVVKDAKGRALSAGVDYDRNIEYELVDNSSRATLKKADGTDWKLGDRELVTINKNDQDQYLTVKVTVKPSSTSKYYTCNKAGISTYYRVLYSGNTLRRTSYTVQYSAAGDNGYEAGNSYFYYAEAGVYLNGELLTLKHGDKELKWGEDFEVAKYAGNNKKGTAKLTIQGKGKYFDTKVITFRIMPKDFKWWEKPVF